MCIAGNALFGVRHFRGPQPVRQNTRNITPRLLVHFRILQSIWDWIRGTPTRHFESRHVWRKSQVREDLHTFLPRKVLALLWYTLGILKSTCRHPFLHTLRAFIVFGEHVKITRVFTRTENRLTNSWQRMTFRLFGDNLHTQSLRLESRELHTNMWDTLSSHKVTGDSDIRRTLWWKHKVTSTYHGSQISRPKP